MAGVGPGTRAWHARTQDSTPLPPNTTTRLPAPTTARFGAVHLRTPLRTDATHHIGKWHQGFHTEAYTPLARGYDTSYGFLVGGEDHYTQDASWSVNCSVYTNLCPTVNCAVSRASTSSVPARRFPPEACIEPIGS